jgi:hypothetical protein
LTCTKYAFFSTDLTGALLLTPLAMITAPQAGVLVAYVLMVISNALSTATTVFNGTDNAQISRENPTYLSPDGATFSIWGFIYLFETFFVIYQALPRFADAAIFADGKTRQWLATAFLVNAIWLPIFSYHRWWLSLIVIVGYLFALHKTYQALGVQYATSAAAAKATPTSVKVFAFTGISLNFAWVVVATLLNFTIVARNSGIIVTAVTTGNITATTAGTVGPLFQEAVIGGNVDWALAMGCVAAAIACYRAVLFADIPYSFVTSWALAGIYRMQMFADDKNFPVEGKSHDLATWALMLSLIVAAFGLFALGKAVYTGCKRTEAKEAVDTGNSLTRRLSSEGNPARV